MESALEAERSSDESSALPQTLQDARERRAAIREAMALLDEQEDNHVLPAEPDAEAIQTRKEQMKARFGASLTEADDVGEMVLQGILNDELYILNDPVSKEMFERRIAEIYEAIDRQFPEDQ